MPTEISRVTKRKRITFGDDPQSYVDVPVVVQITFKDTVKRGQEYTYTVDNSFFANRDVHVDQVPDSGGSQTLDVERIDVWRVKDPVDRGQQAYYTFDNITGGTDQPPHFSTHLKTHVFRYVNPTDDGLWIDSEVIDQFMMKDPVNRGQEAVFTLANPDQQANDSMEDITDSGNGIDPAWRLDPFQNIVNWSAGYYVLFLWQWSDVVWSNAPDVKVEQISVNNYVPYGGSNGPSLVNPLTIDMGLSGAIGVNLINSSPYGPTITPTPITGYQIAACGYAESGASVLPAAPCFNPVTSTFDPVYSASPGNRNDYQQAFLLSVSGSTIDVIMRDVQNHLTYQYFGGSVAIFGGGTYTPTHSGGNAQPGWTVLVFGKNDVVPFLSDHTFPVRVKDGYGNPTGTQSDASNIALTITIESGLTAYVDAGGNQVVGVYNSGGSSGDFTFKLEHVTLTGHKSWPFVYPLTPSPLAAPGGVTVGQYDWQTQDSQSGTANFGVAP